MGQAAEKSGRECYVSVTAMRHVDQTVHSYQVGTGHTVETTAVSHLSPSLRELLIKNTLGEDS